MFPYDWYTRISPGSAAPAIVNVIVEIPKGRRCKFEVDKDTGLFKLDRYLYSSAMYPGDYGFIPQTLAEDGDPLDVLVMVNEPTFTGCLIEARPLGLFRMTDKGFNDYKILAVPAHDPIFAEYEDLWRVPPHFLREVEHFFATYKQLEGGVVKPLGWDTIASARDEIQQSVTRFQQGDEQADTPAAPAADPVPPTPAVAKAAPAKPVRKRQPATKKAATKAAGDKKKLTRRTTRRRGA